MYSKGLEMTSIEKAITSPAAKKRHVDVMAFFLRKLLNDTGHIHKKKVLSLFYSLLVYRTFHISEFLLLRSFCLCVGVHVWVGVRIKGTWCPLL